MTALQALYHTMLEVCMPESLADAADAMPVAERRSRALGLLASGWAPGEPAKYDPEHVLMLARTHAFAPAIVFLCERLKLFREALQVSFSCLHWD